MAYCNECGAYIPDGQTKCLACGYDAIEAEKQAQQASAYEYKYEEPSRIDTDFLKEQLEKQRRRQQENSRKWAETEQAQRRKAQQQGKAHSSSASGSTRSTDAKKYSTPTNFTSSKIFSAMSYFGVLFALPYLLCKEDAFAMFHAKQGLILFVVGIVAEIIASIFGLKWLVKLARIYFIYSGVKNVLEGKREPLPYIGTLF